MAPGTPQPGAEGAVGGEAATTIVSKFEIEIVCNNTSKNRLLSLGPPFCYAQLVVGLLSVR
jgi:hypothetical protein